MQNTRGFTLIELLIVIAIIGILASIVLVSLSGARTKAQLSKALATMESVNKVAASCIISGGTLNIPVSNTTGGGTICSTGTEVLPDLTGTNFTYCGQSCGGWYNSGSSYAISAYSYSYSGGVKIVVCGENHNANGWYGVSSGFDFTGKNACVTYGF